MTEQFQKVLIIDDNTDFLFTMKTFLTRNNYDVLTAEDGEAGLDLCRTESPRIVITDIRLPGMDGLEILNEIKQADSEKEVIIVTGHGDINLAIRALQLHASDFITKPVNRDALLVALDRAKERYETRKKLHDYTDLLEEKWMKTAEALEKMVIFRKRLIDSSIDGIMGCDTHGTTVTFNKSLETMLGYSKDEVCGNISFDRFFQVGDAEQFREQLRADEYGGRNRLFRFETNLIAKNGDRIPVQLSAAVLSHEDEEIGIVTFVRDLREIRKLEQQFADQSRLLQQDKMISLGRLAASVAHEINNPLAGVLNYVRLMIKILNRGPLEEGHTEKFHRYVSLVEGEVSRCSKIVSNLLAFSRKSKLEFSEVDMNELLRKCILLSQHKLTLQSIQVVTELAPEVPKIWGDFNQIQQCIVNLVFNAIDAMPEGGTLTIGSAFTPKDETVEIRLKDTGAGIAPEDLPRIFDPFFTTKQEGNGLGLGLPTVYGIIDRHKGTITVDSQVGKGTTFVIKLPLIERPHGKV
jgi:PAS domain S-box-containing protein